MPRTQSDKHYLDSMSRSLDFYVQLSSTGCKAETRGAEEWGTVKGQWGDALHGYSRWGRRSLLEQFLNSSDDAASIAAFTRKFGPLEQPAVPGQPFEFELKQWRKRQDYIRRQWRFCHGGRTTDKTENEFPVVAGEMFLSISKGRLRYRATNVYRFIDLQLMAVPVERIGVCERYLKSEKPTNWRKRLTAIPEQGSACRAPYFIAHDLRQRYCSEECAAWAKRIAKLRWWNAYRGTARANNRRQRSGGKRSGTHKRGKTWHTHFFVDGVRYRQSLETSDYREALKSEKTLIALAKAGKLAASRQEIARLPFADAAARFLQIALRIWPR